MCGPRSYIFLLNITINTHVHIPLLFFTAKRERECDSIDYTLEKVRGCRPFVIESLKISNRGTFFIRFRCLSLFFSLFFFCNYTETVTVQQGKKRNKPTGTKWSIDRACKEKKDKNNTDVVLGRKEIVLR